MNPTVIHQLSLPPATVTVDLKAALGALNSRGPFWLSVVAWADVDDAATALVFCELVYTSVTGFPASVAGTVNLADASTSLFLFGPSVVLRDSASSDFKVTFTVLSGDPGAALFNYVISVLPVAPP